VATPALTVLAVAYPFAEVSADAAGGAEQVLAMMDRALVRAGHRSIVVAPSGSRVDGELCAIGRVPAAIDGAAREEMRRNQVRAIARVLCEARADVVHFHDHEFPAALDACGQTPVVATLHMPVREYPRATFERADARLALRFVSESQRASAPAAAQAYPVIPNGVDLEAFAPRRARRGFALALGRICPEKGFDRALRAAGRARVPLVLAGRVYPYPDHQRHFTHDIAPHLGPGARFVGPVGLVRKRRLLAAARCLVVPSAVAETSSLVAMEALASGTPVVAWRSGALPELIEPGRTGYIVDSEDQLGEAIVRAAALDGDTCRRAAAARFSMARMAAAYLDLYARIATSAG
jgi:glycosyltransferase involved in cell wall biosynthesis